MPYFLPRRNASAVSRARDNCLHCYPPTSVSRKVDKHASAWTFTTRAASLAFVGGYLENKLPLEGTEAQRHTNRTCKKQIHTPYPNKHWEDCGSLSQNVGQFTLVSNSRWFLFWRSVLSHPKAGTGVLSGNIWAT